MSKKVKVFDEVAEVYDNWYEHHQGKQVFVAERNAIEFMIPCEGLGIEIGAGTGSFAQSLQRDNRIIICLDPSKRMVSVAKQKKLHIVLAYGDYAPFRTVFDFAYMVTVIEFLDDPICTFLDIQQICKSCAMFTLLFINAKSSWGIYYYELGLKGDLVLKHAKLFDLDELLDILKESGYEIVSIKGTLSSKPIDIKVDGNLCEPSDETGVIIVKTMCKHH
jgi:SAM-dependent methyltransferase